MKICSNCKKDNKNEDIYCRNCGIKIKKNSYYVCINVFIFLEIIGIILMIALFVASFLIN